VLHDLFRFLGMVSPAMMPLWPRRPLHDRNLDWRIRPPDPRHGQPKLRLLNVDLRIRRRGHRGRLGPSSRRQAPQHDDGDGQFCAHDTFTSDWRDQEGRQKNHARTKLLRDRRLFPKPGPIGWRSHAARSPDRVSMI
jgi:hypothetical protein